MSSILYQEPVAYTPWLMIPCANNDLTESPGVEPTRAPGALVDLPDVQDDATMSTPPNNDDHPGGDPSAPMGSPQAGPVVGSSANHLDAVTAWGVLAQQQSEPMADWEVPGPFPALVYLQDHWNYVPGTLIPCNNIDLRESPPIALQRSPYKSVELPRVEVRGGSTFAQDSSPFGGNVFQDGAYVAPFERDKRGGMSRAVDRHKLDAAKARAQAEEGNDEDENERGSEEESREPKRRRLG